MDRDIATTSVQCLQSFYAHYQLHQGGAMCRSASSLEQGSSYFNISIPSLAYSIMLGPFVRS